PLSTHLPALATRSHLVYPAPTDTYPLSLHDALPISQSVGGMFGLYFRAAPPSTYAEVLQCDKEAFNRFFHAMLERGVYFAPSAYEAGFVSASHSQADLAVTIAAADAAFGSMS